MVSRIASESSQTPWFPMAAMAHSGAPCLVDVTEILATMEPIARMGFGNSAKNAAGLGCKLPVCGAVHSVWLHVSSLLEIATVSLRPLSSGDNMDPE